MLDIIHKTFIAPGWENRQIIGGFYGVFRLKRAPPVKKAATPLSRAAGKDAYEFL